MVLDDRRERCRPSRGFQEMKTARNQRLAPLSTSCRPFGADSRRTSFLLNAGLLSKGPPGQASPGSRTSSLKLATQIGILYARILTRFAHNPPSLSAELLMLRAADIHRSQSSEERVRGSTASGLVPTALSASRHCRRSVVGLACCDSPKSLPVADLGLLSPKTRQATNINWRQNAPLPPMPRVVPLASVPVTLHATICRRHARRSNSQVIASQDLSTPQRHSVAKTSIRDTMLAGRQNATLPRRGSRTLRRESIHLCKVNRVGSIIVERTRASVGLPGRAPGDPPALLHADGKQCGFHYSPGC